jgi:hypothetical protein
MAPKNKALLCPPRYGGVKKVTSKYPNAIGGTPKIRASFNDAIKESLGKGNDNGASSSLASCSSPDPRSPRLDPFSPHSNLNEKGTETEEFEESISIRRKKEFALRGVFGFLLLFLFWWLFKNSIYRVFGWPINSDGNRVDGSNGYGRDGSSGYSGDGSNGYGRDGSNGNGRDGPNGYKKDGSNGYGGDGSNGYSGDGSSGYGHDGSNGYRRDESNGYGRDGSNGYSKDGSSGYGRDGSNGFGGFGGQGGGPKGRIEKGQKCWFNFPCQYDYEEEEWKKPNR